MAFRLSDALRSFLASKGSLAQALHNGKIKIYSGAQPASANAAPTGTLLCTITAAAAAHTAEVLAAGTLTFSGASGSIDTVTVNSVNVLNGAVAFNGTLAQTVADAATQINRSRTHPDYWATSSGAVLTLTAMPGTGTGPNTYVVAYTATTLTAVAVNMTGGVAAANGLHNGDVAAGVLSKLASQTWSGVNAVAGTAGWFRYEAATADSGALDSTESQIRLDGSVSTAGADMNLSSTSFALSATTTLPSSALTIPASA